MTDLASRTDLPALPEHLSWAKVTRVRHYTERLFAFRVERPAALRFRSGEFVMIGLMLGAKPLLRAYSIASPAWDDGLDFYSIKVPDGPLTQHLQKIAVGDHVIIAKKPTGTLVLDALIPGERIYLFSTGTGIAPFASLIRDPDTYARFGTVILAHGCRLRDELAYGYDIVAEAKDDPLVGEQARAQLVHLGTLTREDYPCTGRLTTLIEDGRLARELGLPPLNPDTDRVMICGSMAFLNDMKALCLARGFIEGSNSGQGTFVVERAFVG